MSAASSDVGPPTLRGALSALEDIAPLSRAGDWDNVGLLVEPPGDRDRGRRITHVHLTVDLTEAVLEEALANDADLIVSYHPPIFRGLKRLVATEAKDRIVMEAIRRGVAIYSPHTALDAAPGGLNDWLLEGFGDVRDVAAIEASEEAPEAAGRTVAGAGRVARLEEPLLLDDLTARIKAHLGLAHVRVAAPDDLASGARAVERVAVCPGAGGSLFAGVAGPDLYLTGEMRHHDVLARVAGGAAVILTDHTNTERGYLPILAARLREALGEGVTVRVSARDRDPLQVT